MKDEKMKIKLCHETRCCFVKNQTKTTLFQYDFIKLVTERIDNLNVRKAQTQNWNKFFFTTRVGRRVARIWKRGGGGGGGGGGLF